MDTNNAAPKPGANVPEELPDPWIIIGEVLNLMRDPMSLNDAEIARDVLRHFRHRHMKQTIRESRAQNSLFLAHLNEVLRFRARIY